MRINFKKPEIPEAGTERIVSRFLWWPKIIDGELRWLETGFWIEKVVTYYHPIIPLPPSDDVCDYLNPCRRWECDRWFGMCENDRTLKVTAKEAGTDQKFPGLPVK